MSESVYVSIEKLNGGYLVDTANGRSIETSLNKAIAKVKATLNGEVEVVEPVSE